MTSAGKRRTPIKRRRKLALRNVTPVAVKARANSSEAVIPVAITTAESGDTQALIPVEVKTAKGKSVKRAALLPVTVEQNRSKTYKSHAKRQPRSAHKHEPKLARSKNRHRHAGVHRNAARPRQQDLLTRGALALTTAEETAVNFAGHLTMTVLDIVPRIVKSGFGLPFKIVEDVTDRTENLYHGAKEVVEELAA